LKRLARLAGLEPVTYGLEVGSPKPQNRKLPVFLVFLVASSPLIPLNRFFSIQSPLQKSLAGFWRNGKKTVKPPEVFAARGSADHDDHQR
jgi:hypothetical protein